ncbi:MAG: outer membrane lipoprotein-sorting protein [Pseudomonadales bacterium]|nr:outer membrane lipoprotein-sorting protein [Pseudomonadales bacterium]
MKKIVSITPFRWVCTFLIFVVFVFPTATLSETLEEKGFRIAAKSDRSDRGFISTDVKLTMLLKSSAGEESIRRLNMKTLEVADERVGDKTLLIFKFPADVKGTALLSHSKILKYDDQWLYLPSLKRVKRISSTNKSGPFMGSEFAFEDFTAMELNKFDYKYIRTEPCGEYQCDVIERFPRYDNSGYTKQTVWIDQTFSQVRTIVFNDRHGEIIKELKLNEYKLYEGKYWRSHDMAMDNVKTGKSTILSFSEFNFKLNLSDGDFTTNALKRIR